MRDIRALDRAVEKLSGLAGEGVNMTESRLSRLRSVKEGAEYLGVCKDTFLAHVEDGDIPFIPVGKGKKRLTRKFAEDDLAEFAASRRQRSAGCQSTSRKTPRSITTISSTKVVGFA